MFRHRLRCDHKQCQDLEEERLDFVKASVWDYANAVSAVCVADDEVSVSGAIRYWRGCLFNAAFAFPSYSQSCERVRVSLENCEAIRDIQQFIQLRGTGAAIPGELAQTSIGLRKHVLKRGHLSRFQTHRSISTTPKASRLRLGPLSKSQTFSAIQRVRNSFLYRKHRPRRKLHSRMHRAHQERRARLREPSRGHAKALLARNLAHRARLHLGQAREAHHRQRAVRQSQHSSSLRLALSVCQAWRHLHGAVQVEARMIVLYSNRMESRNRLRSRVWARTNVRRRSAECQLATSWRARLP